MAYLFPISKGSVPKAPIRYLGSYAHDLSCNKLQKKEIGKLLFTCFSYIKMLTNIIIVHRA